MSGATAMSDTAAAERNKQVVMAFLDTVFNQHRVDEGMAAHMGPVYTQHNPDVPDGREAFGVFFRAFFAERPRAYFDVKRVFCEGDYVTVHAHWTEHPGDRGSAVMDIFRVADGKVVEHWDVMQPVPERMAHANTMF